MPSTRRYTTAFAASEKLYELTDAAFPGAVQVSWGYPGVDAGAELVWVGEFESADQEPAAIGQGRRNESYHVSIYVDVAMETADPADVNVRVAEHVRVLEEVLADNPTLDGALHSDGWAEIADVETVVATQPATDTAFAGVARVRVACRARI